MAVPIYTGSVSVPSLGFFSSTTSVPGSFAGAVTTGPNPYGFVSIGDINSSRGTSSGVVILGGVTERAVFDYGLTTAHTTTLSGTGGSSTGNLTISGAYKGTSAAFTNSGGGGNGVITIGSSLAYSGQAIKIFSGGGANQYTDITTSAASLQTIAGTAVLIDVDGSTNIFSVDRSGNIAIAGSSASKASGTAWSNLSDARVKENVAPYRKGLAGVVALNPVTFTFNGKGGTTDDGKTHVGFIAQDVQAVHPEMVSIGEYADQKDPLQSIPDLLGLDTSDITPMLVNAIKEIYAYMQAHP